MLVLAQYNFYFLAPSELYKCRCRSVGWSVWGQFVIFSFKTIWLIQIIYYDADEDDDEENDEDDDEEDEEDDEEDDDDEDDNEKMIFFKKYFVFYFFQVFQFYLDKTTFLLEL